MKDMRAELERIEDVVKATNHEVAGYRKEIARRSKFTAAFLKNCSKLGIERVSIGKSHPSVPASANWPFPPGSSVFQFPTEQKDEGGWTAIWKVVSDMGISGGCGNNSQHQVTECDLMSGVFEVRKGVWERID